MQLQFLKCYLEMIVDLIEAEFKEEYDKPHAFDQTSVYTPVINPEILNEMAEVIRQVNAICNEKRKWYILDQKKAYRPLISS